MAGRTAGKPLAIAARCKVESLDERAGRAAGALCGASGTSDVVDAAVVIGAIERNDAVVTSDEADINVLARAAGHDLVIHSV